MQLLANKFWKKLCLYQVKKTNLYSKTEDLPFGIESQPLNSKWHIFHLTRRKSVNLLQVDLRYLNAELKLNQTDSSYETEI